MKKITSILLFLSALLYVSCDALDLSPEDYYGSGNFWTKEAQVEGYMNGLHNNLRSSYTMFYVLGEASWRYISLWHIFVGYIYVL